MVVIPSLRSLQLSLEGLINDPYLRCSNVNPASYVEVFVDDFSSLSQGPTQRRRHRQSTLFHALYKLFQYLDSKDMSNRKEVFSLKKIETGDFIWFIYQVLLGWVVDTINITESLPPHQ